MAKTLTVMCKLPHGIDLTSHGLGVLNGANHESARQNNGYGMTEGVDADAWEAFRGDMRKRIGDDGKSEVGGFEPLDSGAIIVADRTDMARGQAKDADPKKVAAPMDPNDPRGPDGKRIGVQPTDETKKELAKGPPPPERRT